MIKNTCTNCVSKHNSKYRNQNKITQDSIVDITPFEAITMIEENFENMKKYYYCIPSDLMEVFVLLQLNSKRFIDYA